MNTPSHPIWKLASLAVIMLALVVILWLNAEKFDITELRAILAFFGVIVGKEVAESYVKKFTGQ